VADLGAVRAALANQIAAKTGLRVMAEAKDSIQPPVAVILPGQPYVTYGATMDGAFTCNLRVLIAISDAAPSEAVQRALDSFLGIGENITSSSIPEAIMVDPTLGGACHFAEPIAIESYGRLLFNGVTFFGARIGVQCGVI